MKKKGSKQIPDFSSHRPEARSASGPTPNRDASPRGQPPRAPTVKPQMTSSKSGRRGQ